MPGKTPTLMAKIDEVRARCNRLERIVLDTIITWQWNKVHSLKERGGELFGMDELLEVIGGYGPWSGENRELPVSAIYYILGWFEREGLIKKLDGDNWKICFSV
jgi:hypothetical protein